MDYVDPGYVRSGYVRLDSDTQGGFIFDGVSRRIIIASGVTSISMPDMYSRWIDWTVVGDNSKWPQAMRYSGYDPIPGGVTGATFFLMNGWKMVYDPSLVGVAGVLYSEDYATAFWTAAGNPVYPATVAALVNTSITMQNVVTGTVPSLSAIADAVWAKELP